MKQFKEISSMVHQIISLHGAQNHYPVWGAHMSWAGPEDAYKI
jgi:hypothetical protein